MRHTSKRRRSGYSHAVAHRSGIVKAQSDSAQPVLLREDGTPGSVVCGDCSARVMSLHDGKTPVAHAPGGYRVNPQTDRFRCTNSGHESHQLTGAYGRTIMTEDQARKLRLVTIPMVARAAGVSELTVRGFMRQDGFPKPVSILYVEDKGYVDLYSTGTVMTFPAIKDALSKRKRSA